MQTIITMLDRFAEITGKLLGAVLFLLMLNTCVVVFMRYGLGQGSTVLQELVTYLHATAFMLAMGYALRKDAHVRVDVFYGRFNPIQKAWVNALGTLIFLMPLCGYIFLSSTGFVSGAWSVKEGSADGGIQGVFLLKTLIPSLALLLFAQAVSELIRNALVIAQGADQHD